MPLPIRDTRELFRPLCGEIAGLLRGLSIEDWDRLTMAGNWRVRDVVAHLCDTAMRRLSFQRDRLMPAAEASRRMSEHDLTALVNDLNATWIRVAERFSPPVLIELYEHASGRLVEFIETLDPLADAAFPVSWAGESVSQQWLDVGREFTEIWHHGSQIREAVGAGPFRNPLWLKVVLQISMHALPHAYRDVRVPAEDVSIVIQVTGPASGTWTLRRAREKWDINEGDSPVPAAAVTMQDETAWRLLFNALSHQEAQALVTLDGNLDLARPILAARSVIV